MRDRILELHEYAKKHKFKVGSPNKVNKENFVRLTHDDLVLSICITFEYEKLSDGRDIQFLHLSIAEVGIVDKCRTIPHPSPKAPSVSVAYHMLNTLLGKYYPTSLSCMYELYEAGQRYTHFVLTFDTNNVTPIQLSPLPEMFLPLKKGSDGDDYINRFGSSH